MKLMTKIATLCLLLGGLSTSPGIFAAEHREVLFDTMASPDAKKATLYRIIRNAVCT